MKFINSTPVGRNNPRAEGNSASIYHTQIKIKVFDQDDFFGGGDWRFGDLGVPRWEHTFSDRGEAAYKPDSGDTHKYKAVVTADWKEETASGGSWKVTGSGSSRKFIEHLKDGGQWIDIQPAFGQPREIALMSGVDQPPNPLFVGPAALYMIHANGDLRYYHHDAAGSFDVISAFAGNGWDAPSWVLPVRDGGFYVVKADGDLYWYHHDANFKFDDDNGRKIGSGWGGFSWLGAGRFGQLYVIKPGGDLCLYQHDGAFNWTLQNAQIGNGWPTANVITGGTNCLYRINEVGDLLYYYHDDNRAWKHQSMKIGSQWQVFTSISSSGNGELYGVHQDGTLRFYRHDVDKNWVAGSGRTIGTGWNLFDRHGLLAPTR